MAKLSLILVIIGSLLMFFTPYAIVLVAIGALLAIIAAFVDKRSKAWVLSLILSFFYLVGIGWYTLKQNLWQFDFPQWSYLPSAADYYFGPTYMQKSNNFNFDSLMSDRPRTQQIMSIDTAVGPDDAPLD